MNRMTRAGNRPILKIYPDTGHFIHADNEVEFPADVVDFVTTGNVDTNSPVSIDHLINGAVPAERSRLLLFQEARSGHGRSQSEPERLLLE